MWKKACGHEQGKSTEEIRAETLKKIEEAKETTKALQQKKQEYYQIKHKRIEKQILKEKEEKQAASYSFAKKSQRKPNFLSKISTQRDGYFQYLVDATEDHGKYMDDRDKMALIFPNKVKDHTVKWDYQHRIGDTFQTMVGREVDKFDADKQRYFEKPLRPLGHTMQTVMEKRKDGTFAKVEKVGQWGYVTKHLNPIEKEKPMIDNTHTPRKKTRAITIDRVKEKKVWQPNNFSLHEFDKLKSK